jgi:hypothetical protein
MRRMFIKNIVSFLRDRLNKLRVILTGIFYGMSAYELELELRKEQGYLNNLFTAMIFGDMAGLPMFPPLLLIEAFALHNPPYRLVEKKHPA